MRAYAVICIPFVHRQMARMGGITKDYIEIDGGHYNYRISCNKSIWVLQEVSGRLDFVYSIRVLWILQIFLYGRSEYFKDVGKIIPAT